MPEREESASTKRRRRRTKRGAKSQWRTVGQFSIVLLVLAAIVCVLIMTGFFGD